MCQDTEVIYKNLHVPKFQYVLTILPEGPVSYVKLPSHL